MIKSFFPFRPKSKPRATGFALKTANLFFFCSFRVKKPDFFIFFYRTRIRKTAILGIFVGVFDAHAVKIPPI